jgi:hypothetical protein
VASISQLTVSRLSRQCGIPNISQPYRPPRPVTGMALLSSLLLHKDFVGSFNYTRRFLIIFKRNGHTKGLLPLHLHKVGVPTLSSLSGPLRTGNSSEESAVLNTTLIFSGFVIYAACILLASLYWPQFSSCPPTHDFIPPPSAN